MVNLFLVAILFSGAAIVLVHTWRQRRAVVLILLLSALPCAVLFSTLPHQGKGALVSRLHDIKTPDL